MSLKGMFLILSGSLFLAGCSGKILEVKSIPAESLDNVRSGPVPQALLDEAETRIRRIVTSIHDSGITERVFEGKAQDEFRIEAQLIERLPGQRDTYTGERFSCSRVNVITRLNYHKAYYDKMTGRSYVRNNDVIRREDRICRYDSGHVAYSSTPRDMRETH